jgi:hypothetical protein
LLYESVTLRSVEPLNCTFSHNPVAENHTT